MFKQVSANGKIIKGIVSGNKRLWRNEPFGKLIERGSGYLIGYLSNDNGEVEFRTNFTSMKLDEYRRRVKLVVLDGKVAVPINEFKMRPYTWRGAIMKINVGRLRTYMEKANHQLSNGQMRVDGYSG